MSQLVRNLSSYILCTWPYQMSCFVLISTIMVCSTHHTLSLCIWFYPDFPTNIRNFISVVNSICQYSVSFANLCCRSLQYLEVQCYILIIYWPWISLASQNSVLHWCDFPVTNVSVIYLKSPVYLVIFNNKILYSSQCLIFPIFQDDIL